MDEGFFVFIKVHPWTSGCFTYSRFVDILAIRSSDYHSKCLCRFSLTLSSVQQSVAMTTNA